MGIIPQYFKELRWADFWGGIKADVVKGAKTLQNSGRAVLGGITSALTPTIIWLVIVIIVGLLLYSWLRKTVKI